MKHKNKILYLCLLISSILYFFLIGEKGYILMPDSNSYIFLSATRDPFYPLLLKLFSFVFGTSHYLNFIVLFQGSLAIFAIFFTLNKFRKLFLFNNLSIVVTFLLLLCPYGLSSMWSSPRVNYIHYILTEGINYSLYYIFVILLFESIVTKKIKSYYLSLFVFMIVVLTRAQLIVLYPLFFLVLIYISKKQWKTLVFRFLILFFSIISINLSSKLYHLVYFGHFEDSSENSITLLANAIYAADLDDAFLFNDTDLKELFIEIYSQADNNGWTHSFAKNGLINNGDHIRYSHDKIKSEIIRESLFQYVESYGYSRNITEDYSGDLFKKEVANELVYTLIMDNFPQWLYDRISSIPFTFMISLLAVTPPSLFLLCYILTFLFFLGYLFLIFFNLHRSGLSSSVLFALLIISSIILNAAGICLVIYPAMRYTDYNIGLIYLATFLLLKQTRKSSNTPNLFQKTERVI